MKKHDMSPPTNSCPTNCKPTVPKSNITLSLIPVIPAGWRRRRVTSAGAVALKHKKVPH